MNESVMTPPARPSRRLAVYGALWVCAAAVGWGTNGGMLLNVVFGGLVLAGLGRAMVRETRAVRPLSMTFAAWLQVACWFAVVAFVLLFPFWLEIAGALWVRLPH